MKRFPGIQVSVHSRNPLAVVAAVREQMRRAALEAETIQRFSDEALSQEDGRGILAVCDDWVDVRTD